MSPQNVRRIVPSSFEGVQLCLVNSERLFIDAERVSPPTQMALLELSLEELSKAYVLFLQWLQKRIDELKPQGSRKALERILRGKSGYLQKSANGREEDSPYIKDLLRPLTVEEFRRHSVKLERMRALVTLLKQKLPATRQKAMLQPLLEHQYGYIDWDKQRNAYLAAHKAYQMFLDGIKEEGFTDLSDLKERGFYVDFANSYISPMALPQLTGYLASLVGLLIAQLKADVQTFAKL